MPQTTPAPGQWTVEDVWRLPDDGNRYEVIDGVLYVTPAPRYVHQDAVAVFHRLLHAYLMKHPAGWPRHAPADIVFGPRDGIQPDLFVAPLVDGRRPADWKEVTQLLLAVEILSPSTASRDRREKRRLYQHHADEYWIVDLDARLIERWRPADVRPEVLEDTVVWQPAGAAEPLVVDLPAVFRETWGE